jgi:hypothetical protein
MKKTGKRLTKNTQEDGFLQHEKARKRKETVLKEKISVYIKMN